MSVKHLLDSSVELSSGWLDIQIWSSREKLARDKDLGVAEHYMAFQPMGLDEIKWGWG
jgi:hypothetical protein